MATATAARAKRKGRKAAESDTVQRLGRLGLVARGVLYAVVGGLAASVAFGADEQADKQGALRAIGSTPVGRWSLLIVVAGFVGYALWRLAEATVRPGDKGVGGRLWSAGHAVLYTGFAFTTLSFVATQHSENSDATEQNYTAQVLKWPGGRYLVAAVGLTLIGVGVGNAYRAVSGRYRKHLKEQEIPESCDWWFPIVAYAGLAARAVAFSLVGAFLVQAAVTFDPKKARGLDGSLRLVAQQWYGRPLIFAVAIGLVAYGVWSCVEARYRKILGS
ncbi:MAG TPA: DUF1206 domain-containing protein [Frankiaceae bacterium]|nr:DUF1206 domain-containing protein [Frankiaceae bacterium]